MRGSIRESSMSEEIDSKMKAEASPSTTPREQAWRRFKRNRLAVLGGWFLVALVAIVLVCPLFSHYKPDALSDAQFQRPGGEHLLGTDAHGRDLLVRLCYGAQISFVVGIVGAVVSLVIGVL